LIHNGIVDVNKGDLKRSTCDSEKILNLYNKLNVVNKPSNIKKVASLLSGYYACAVFSKMKDGTLILDVFRDDRANLYAAYINELQTVVFSTSLNDVTSVAKEMGLTVASPYSIKNNMLIRFNALTGKVLLTQKFKPKHVSKSTNTANYYQNEFDAYDAWEKQNYGGNHYMDRVGNVSKIHERAANNEKSILSMVNDNTKDDGWVYNSKNQYWYKVNKG
jgi:hypothetical protein